MVSPNYSFEAWFDVKVMSEEAADSAIVEEEKKSNILGMLHQVRAQLKLYIELKINAITEAKQSV